MAHHNCPFDLNAKPIHRMSRAQETAWLRGGDPKRLLGDWLVKRYPGGGAVTSPGFLLVGWFDNRGNCNDLSPPFQVIHYSKVANAPEVPTCPCGEFYDPETNGPWRLRGSREHHPLCQYEPASTKVWDILQARGVQAPIRPDDWEKIRQQARQS